jgi:hypothetical protein
VARKVFLAMLDDAGFINPRCVGTGQYRTSTFTQAAFFIAQKSA